MSAATPGRVPPPPQDLSDAELEQHIVDCGKHFVKAHELGDIALAQEWLAHQTEAAMSRSPAQIARMEKALGLDQGCYFECMGAEARVNAQAEGRIADA